MDRTMYAPVEANALEGYSRVRRQFHEAQVASAVMLLRDVMRGRVPSYYIQEAIAPRTPALVRSLMGNYPGLIRVSESMTTSDFPLLTGDVLDRMMLQRFRDYPATWRRYVKVTNNLRDFRSVSRLAMTGLDDTWDKIPEADEITYANPDEAEYTYTPAKYGKAVKLSWELIVNDDLRAFDDIPNWLGVGGARTIAHFVTTLYVDANGPHASVYTVGNGNIVTGNPVLSITGLATAYGILANKRDAAGNPILIESVVLVVPPALEITARNIVNATLISMTNTGGASGQELGVNNWFGSRFEVVVNPWIPVVASVADGNTSWYLFATPSVNPPAIEVGFVRGFEEPQLFQKVANTARLGGGVAQELGDFHTMSTEYKGLVAFGGAVIDPNSTVASEGDGS